MTYFDDLKQVHDKQKKQRLIEEEALAEKQRQQEETWRQIIKAKENTCAKYLPLIHEALRILKDAIYSDGRFVIREIPNGWCIGSHYQEDYGMAFATNVEVKLSFAENGDASTFEVVRNGRYFPRKQSAKKNNHNLSIAERLFGHSKSNVIDRDGRYNAKYTCEPNVESLMAALKELHPLHTLDVDTGY